MFVRSLCALALSAACAVTIPSVAAMPMVAADTMGPDWSFDSKNFYVGGSPGYDNGEALKVNWITAEQFTPSVSGRLQTGYFAMKSLPLFDWVGPSVQVRVSIYADANGLPGQQVATSVSDVSVTFPGDPAPGQVYGFDFFGQEEIWAGRTYWLGVSAAQDEPPFAIGWYFNDEALRGPRSFTGMTWQAPGEWYPALEGVRAAYQLTVMPLSAPGGLALAAPWVLVALVGVGRWRKSA